MKKNPIYIAPYDFDEASNQNLRNALRLAEMNNGVVFLIHVVKINADRFKYLERLLEVKNDLPEDQGKKVEVRVLVGNYLEDINKAAVVLDAEMVTMTIQNPVTFGSLFGSHELKMIGSSFVPYLIAQNNSQLGEINNIALPFSFATESIQVVKYMAHFAKKVNAKIHLVGCHKKDEFLENQMKVNEKVLKRYLSDSGADFDIIDIPVEANFDSAFLEYTEKSNIDIIAATYYTKGFFNPNSFIQEMINNDCKVPLITINAEEFSHSTHQFSFLGV